MRVKCPECGRGGSCIKITPSKIGTIISYFSLKCKECGHTWEDRWQDPID